METQPSSSAAAAEEEAHQPRDMAKFIPGGGGTGRDSLMMSGKLAGLLKKHQIDAIEQCIFPNCLADFHDPSQEVSGCCLAHEMGLGKSLTGIVSISIMMNNPCLSTTGHDSPKPKRVPVSRVILLVPAMGVQHWLDQLMQWGNILDGSELRTYNLSGCNTASRKHSIYQWERNGGVLLLSHDLFQQVQRTKNLGSTQPDLLVIDEGHRILKNTKTKTFQGLCAIKTRRKILLTGTPMENNTLEFYHLVNFCRPGIFGVSSEAHFERLFRRPIERGLPTDAPEYARRESLTKQRELHALSKSVLHREKKDSLKDKLPSKHDYLVSLPMTYSQLSIVRQFDKETNKSGQRLDFFSRYQTLGPILNHPGCFNMMIDREANEKSTETSEKPKKSGTSKNGAESICEVNRKLERKNRTMMENLNDASQSPKLVVLAHIIAMAILSNEKVLVFSKCLKTLVLVQRFLQSKNWKRQVESLDDPKFDSLELGGLKKNKGYLYIDGSVDPGKRGALVDKFHNNDETRVFLISSVAGGIAVDLTAATRIVMLDHHFNPGVAEQCIARSHRMGQNRSVFCYRLAMAGSMERKVYNRGENKTFVSSAVVDGKEREHKFLKSQLDSLHNDTWVRCDRCKKWRVLPKLQEPPKEDALWYCEMNDDKKANKCASAEEEYIPPAKPEDPFLQHLVSINSSVKRAAPPQKVVAYWSNVHCEDQPAADSQSKERSNSINHIPGDDRGEEPDGSVEDKKDSPPKARLARSAKAAALESVQAKTLVGALKASRGLRAYDIFFREERAKILAKHEESAMTTDEFERSTKTIRKRWRGLTDEQKAEYMNKEKMENCTSQEKRLVRKADDETSEERLVTKKPKAGTS